MSPNVRAVQMSRMRISARTLVWLLTLGTYTKALLEQLGRVGVRS